MKKNEPEQGHRRCPMLKKLIDIMKLTSLIFFLALFQVSATSYSQVTRLNLRFQNETLESVFEKIEANSEFSIFYKNELIKSSYAKSGIFRDALIFEILDEVLAAENLTYTVKDKLIIIVPKEQVQQQEAGLQQQPGVSGKVTDKSGEPMPGVTVVVKGTTMGTITDASGNYALGNVPPNATLVFSFVGMRTQEVIVGNQTAINVSLQEETFGIEEVVAVGYGTMKKSDLTGSSVSVNIEAFRESPNVSILQSLQGSVPGVTIGQTTRPGQEASIDIRGVSTLSGNKSVLIVVDGIIFSGRFSDINPADVASVEVLKDASSKAIYGAQAANGIILVTSKAGRKGEKPTFNYSSSLSSSTPTNNTQLLGRDDFLKKVRDLEWRNSYTPESGYTLENPNWNYTLSSMNPQLLDGIDAGNDYDWYNEVTRPSFLNSHTLSASGGSEKTTFYMSAGYTDQKGFIINDDYSRWTLRLNIDTKINDWFTLGANTSGSFTDFSGDAPTMDNLVRTSPLVNPWDSNGNLVIYPVGDSRTNVLLNSSNDNYEARNRFVGNFYGVVSIPGIEGLTYRLNYGNNAIYSKDFGSSIYGAGQTGSAYKNNAYQMEQTLDNIINYTRQYDKHSVNATFVYGYSTAKFERTAASGQGYSDLDLSYNNLALAEIQKIESGGWDESSLYQMFRIGYNYQQKYLLTATMRRDGFSAFSKNNKTALFPSVGLGWILTQEEFFKVPAVSYLKIRASYGENGNKVARYSSLAVVEALETSKYVFGDGSSTYIGRSVKTLANNDLKWEKTQGLNVGVDFSLMNDRVKGNVEYYDSNTKDLLWSMVIPQTSGFANVLSNIGELNNKGLEFFVQGTPIKRTDFLWEIGVNFSRNRNSIVSLLGEDKDGDGKEDDLISSRLFIGKPIGTIYDYQVDGIWQVGDEIPAGFEPGSYKIVDQNGDGNISPDQDRLILGNEEPAYQFGIQNTLNYKQFTLRFFINSIQGGKSSYMRANHATGGFNTVGNATNANWFDFYDYWAPTRPDAKFANPWVGSPVRDNARLYEQRNFVRLQDISLSYNVRKSFAHKIGVQNMKVHVSGKNLMTLTNWDGWDPETGQGITSHNAFPLMKSYTFGVDLTF